MHFQKSQANIKRCQANTELNISIQFYNQYELKALFTRSAKLYKTLLGACCSFKKKTAVKVRRCTLYTPERICACSTVFQINCREENRKLM